MQVGSRNVGARQENTWLRVVLLVVAWLLIISLVRDVWQIRTGFGRITESRARLELEEEKNVNLRQKLGLVSGESYRERLIREKLNMQREGEVLVVLPKEGMLETGVTPKLNRQPPNWQKWWNLIR